MGKGRHADHRLYFRYSRVVRAWFRLEEVTAVIWALTHADVYSLLRAGIREAKRPQIITDLTLYATMGQIQLIHLPASPDWLHESGRLLPSLSWQLLLPLA